MDLEEEKRKLLRHYQTGVLTEQEYEQRLFELENAHLPDREDWNAIWNQIKNS